MHAPHGDLGGAGPHAGYGDMRNWRFAGLGRDEQAGGQAGEQPAGEEAGHLAGGHPNTQTGGGAIAGQQ